MNGPSRRSTHRSTRWPPSAVGALLVVAVAAACSSSDGGGAGPDRPEPVGDPIDLSAVGFHELPAPPIAERGRHAPGPMVVWTGEVLVVWGGIADEDDSTSPPGRLLGDGATLSLDDGRWTPMPPAPFVEGLYLPVGAWDGEEVIVIGTECEASVPPATDGSPPACPRGPAAGAYDPTTGTWRRLRAPPIPVDPDWQAPVLHRARAVGVDGGAAFAFGWASDAITWDRASESWTHVGSPFDRVADRPIDVESCVDQVEGTVVAALTFQPGVGERSPVKVLDARASAWEDTGIEVAALSRSGFSCGDGALVSWTADREGRSAQVVDLATGAALKGDEPSDRLGEAMPWAVGPWVFTANFARPGEVFATTGAVAPLRTGTWQELDLEAAEGFGGPSNLTTYVPGVGVVGGRIGLHDAFGLWRAPAELLP